MNKPEEEFKSCINAMTSVISNVGNLSFPDQLALYGLIFKFGTDCKAIAKRNNIKIVNLMEADTDFTKFKGMKWGVIDSGEE